MAEPPPPPPTTIPKTMKSYTSTSLGSPRRALSFHPASPVPSLPDNDPSSTLLLLKITHAALNPADLALQLVLPPWLPFRKGPVPGLDFAGIVVAVGGGVASAADGGVEVGERVCGALGLAEVARGKGTLAEWVVVESGLVAKVPAGWGGREAVGVMGIAGQTAAEMVRRAGEVKGRRVLVNGAAGGVGTLVVQVWKGLGGEVVGVCSKGSEALVRRLGAEEVVDYQAHQPLEEHLAVRFGEQQFDAILDCVGSHALFAKSPKYLKPDGKVISIVGGWSQGVVPFVRSKLWPRFLGGTPRSFELFLLGASGQRAKEVAAWVEQGVIKEGLVDSEYPMEQAVEAYEKLATHRAKGKIVINIGSS